MIKATLLDTMGSDRTVSNAARVSFAKHKEVYDEKDAKLIRFLAREGHYAPFGHCFASFRVTAPIYVSRQCVKHEYLRFSEESRRYISDEPEFFRPVLRSRTSDKKQGSGPMLADSSDQHALIDTLNAQALSTYHDLLDSGVCEEQARGVLPTSMMTSWVWSGSLDAWASMVNLRDHPEAQRETQQVAQQISHKLSVCFEDSWNALTGKGLPPIKPMMFKPGHRDVT